MNKFEPRGYLTLERALEHYGQWKHPDEWEAEKASIKREFQQLLFAADLSAMVLTNDGILHSLRSNIWGSVEAERIFETGRASISVGDEYFPDVLHGPVLIERSSIDALFDGDSDDPSKSPEAISDGALTDEPSPTPDLKGGTTALPPKKRGGGLKRGPYYGKLKKHLKWRKNEKDDLDTASLKELREDARGRLTTDGVKGIPKTRSGLDDAIRAVLRDLGVNR